MPSMSDRINITTARTQVNLKGNVLDEKLVITKAITGKKRGRQQAKTRLRDIRSVIGQEDGYIMFKEEIFFKLPSGNLLPEVWMDIYEWFSGGMAPKKWIEALNRTVPSTFNDIDKRNEMMTKLV